MRGWPANPGTTSATSAVPRPPVKSNFSSGQTKIAGKTYYFATWLALIGLILPAWEVQFLIAGAKFTAGRLGISLLCIPAIFILLQTGRRPLVCDMFAFLTAAWIIVAASYATDLSSLSSAGAESMEFIVSYIVGRAFFFQPAALEGFIRVLKLLAIAVIVLAVAENISGRWIAHEIAAKIFGTSALTEVFRGNTIRATSTLDHPILFGVFCALVGAILMFWETKSPQRIISSGLCLLGCVLSQSSAALMCFVLVLSAYNYDRFFRRVSQRWIIFWTVVGIGVGSIFLLSEHPIGWLISHLTLDPETGYYRILIWDAALDRISESPWTGYSLELFNENILDSTVDCVWLVLALRFGIPASLLLFFTNLAAIWPTKPPDNRAQDGNGFDERMSLAFTIVLLMFIFAGITVHFWNYMWIFWGLCIGIRVSLKERKIATIAKIKVRGSAMLISTR